ELAAERRAVQGSRRVPDGAVLRGGPLPVTPHVREAGLGRIGVRLANGLLSLYWRGAGRRIARRSSRRTSVLPPARAADAGCGRGPAPLRGAGGPSCPPRPPPRSAAADRRGDHHET